MLYCFSWFGECDTHEELAVGQSNLGAEEGCQHITVEDRKAAAAQYATQISPCF